MKVQWKLYYFVKLTDLQVEHFKLKFQQPYRICFSASQAPRQLYCKALYTTEDESPVLLSFYVLQCGLILRLSIGQWRPINVIKSVICKSIDRAKFGILKLFYNKLLENYNLVFFICVTRKLKRRMAIDLVVQNKNTLYCNLFLLFLVCVQLRAAL